MFMIPDLISIQDLNIDDVTKELSDLISEKSEALNILNIAVNEYIRLKNEYLVKSNELKIKPTMIQEELGLSRAATEKQIQAYVDDKFKDLVRDLNIARENVSSWKRDVDLINDKISVEKLKLRIFLEMTR